MCFWLVWRMILDFKFLSKFLENNQRIEIIFSSKTTLLTTSSCCLRCFNRGLYTIAKSSSSNLIQEISKHIRDFGKHNMYWCPNRSVRRKFMNREQTFAPLDCRITFKRTTDPKFHLRVLQFSYFPPTSTIEKNRTSKSKYQMTS